MPLHCEESLHDRLSWSLVLASHVAALEQSTRHGPSPHVVLQLLPAAQLHSDPEHAHPVPVQVGGPLLPLHALANTSTANHASRIPQS